MEGKNELRDQVVRQLKEIGEHITSEQADIMLETMKHLVTLSINQYFRRNARSKDKSSTKS